MHNCQICNLLFSRKAHVKRHMERAHLKKKYSCDKCNFEAKNLETVKSHKQREHQGKTTKCDQWSGMERIEKEVRINPTYIDKTWKLPHEAHCDFSSVTDYTLKRHTKSLHENIWQECKSCGQNFSSPSALHNHEKEVHTAAENGPLFTCDQCEIKLSTRKRLKIHKITVHDRRVERYDQCDYQAKTPLSMKNHKDYVHKGIAFSCPDCDYQAKSKVSLRRHYQIKHRGVRYTCDVCEKPFTRKAAVHDHKINKHNGIKFQCDKCEYKATFKNNLKVHHQAMHETSIYTCDHCDYVSSTNIFFCLWWTT